MIYDATEEEREAVDAAVCEKWLEEEIPTAKTDKAVPTAETDKSGVRAQVAAKLYRADFIAPIVSKNFVSAPKLKFGTWS